MRLGISQRESLAVLASLIHHCRAVDPASYATKTTWNSPPWSS
ncbi:MAG: hypothetical protein U1U88_001950 [Lawsonella clevelandensis]